MTTYSAKILGEEREVCGFNLSGNLIVAGNEEWEIVPLGMEPPTFRSLKIREIDSLIYSGGEWLLGGKKLETAWFSEVGHPRDTERGTKVFTLFELRRILTGHFLGPDNPQSLSDSQLELQEKVVAVAWTWQKFRDYPEQKPNASERKRKLAAIPGAKAFKPVLLSAFQRINKTPHSPPDAPAKQVAHFTNDFNVAVIPQSDGSQKRLAIEHALWTLIRRIIDAGGQIPRTKLRKDKFDSYQPEKLLKSQTATELISAKLIGTFKIGRATTFWAKTATD